MRIIGDGYANIDQAGERLYTNVRFMHNDQGVIGVFTEGKTPPTVTLPADDVVVTKLRGCVPCKGDTPQVVLKRLWEQSEKAHSV